MRALFCSCSCSTRASDACRSADAFVECADRRNRLRPSARPASSAAASPRLGAPAPPSPHPRSPAPVAGHAPPGPLERTSPILAIVGFRAFISLTRSNTMTRDPLTAFGNNWSMPADFVNLGAPHHLT